MTTDPNANSPGASRRGDLVSPDDACPVCGERDIDSLVWLNDDTVRCATCGTEYHPGRRLSQRKGGDDART